ncbi:MAG: protein translocase subunit SecF, partial [Dehalococcoidia bacterium]|jgi:preprotein translocase subunit SecF|nr:protein translocase subunit SecF [Dehalococcoidia bacterium]
VDFEKPVEMAQVRDALEQAGQTDVIVQRTGSDFFMRMREISPDQKVSLEAQLTERLGPMVVRDFASVSAIVSKEIGRDAGFAIAAAAVGILLYVAWAFRRLAKPWRYGVSAIIALVHDVLVVLGLFSLLGRLFGVQVDATFIAAILAVVGYSVNNTVVVYDRIRENTVRGISRDYVQVVNQSLVESLVRSLNTSLTTLFVVLALFLFGGETIRYFTLVFIIGITAGTYSSLFISSQLLVVWESKRWGRIWTRTA